MLAWWWCDTGCLVTHSARDSHGIVSPLLRRTLSAGQSQVKSTPGVVHASVGQIVLKCNVLRRNFKHCGRDRSGDVSTTGPSFPSVRQAAHGTAQAPVHAVRPLLQPGRAVRRRTPCPGWPRNDRRLPTRCACCGAKIARRATVTAEIALPDQALCRVACP